MAEDPIPETLPHLEKDSLLMLMILWGDYSELPRWTLTATTCFSQCKGESVRYFTHNEEKGCVESQAETGVMWPLFQERQQAPASGRSKDGIFPEAHTENAACQCLNLSIEILISDFQPPEWWGNKFLLFITTKFVLKGIRKPMQHLSAYINPLMYLHIHPQRYTHIQTHTSCASSTYIYTHTHIHNYICLLIITKYFSVESNPQIILFSSKYKRN